MVQRLNAAQTEQILRDLAPDGYTNLRVPEPVTEEAVAGFCVPLVNAPVGRSYGMFDDSLRPTGVFVGLVIPDPLTGSLIGIEHVWWVRPKVNGLPLLQKFEEDCKEEGCKRVVCGYSS